MTKESPKLIEQKLEPPYLEKNQNKSKIAKKQYKEFEKVLRGFKKIPIGEDEEGNDCFLESEMKYTTYRDHPNHRKYFFRTSIHIKKWWSTKLRISVRHPIFAISYFPNWVDKKVRGRIEVELAVGLRDDVEDKYMYLITKEEKPGEYAVYPFLDSIFDIIKNKISHFPFAFGIDKVYVYRIEIKNIK